jgi:26S proteasome regulatory subunit T1
MAEKTDEEKKPMPLDEQDINLLKTYGVGPYAEAIKKTEEENRNFVT